MKLGAFMMPSHPPERSIRDGYRWDLQQLERLDGLGFHEAWIGEHFTAPWEPNPAPDLLIAQALLRTERIKLCPWGASASLPPPSRARAPRRVSRSPRAGALHVRGRD